MGFSGFPESLNLCLLAMAACFLCSSHKCLSPFQCFSFFFLFFLPHDITPIPLFLLSKTLHKLAGPHLSHCGLQGARGLLLGHCSSAIQACGLRHRNWGSAQLQTQNLKSCKRRSVCFKYSLQEIPVFTGCDHFTKAAGRRRNVSDTH